MIVGIDIGGSTTDAVILENGGIQLVTIEANDPVAAAAGALGKLVSDFGIKLEEVECVAATGAGSRVLTKSLLGRPVVKVNEFTAIGIGGTSLAGLDSALVVSLGTGTAIVSATRDKIEHVSGTGVGGGTLLGLAKHTRSGSRPLVAGKAGAQGRSAPDRSQRSRHRGRLDRRLAAEHYRRELRQGQRRRDARGQGASHHEHDHRIYRRARTCERSRLWPGKYRAHGQAVAPVPIHAGDETPQFSIWPLASHPRACRFRDRDRCCSPRSPAEVANKQQVQG